MDNLKYISKYTGQQIDEALRKIISGEIIGKSGENGRKVELRAADEYIQWRYEGEIDWNNLISLSELIGPQGEQGDIDAAKEYVDTQDQIVLDQTAPKNHSTTSATDAEEYGLATNNQWGHVRLSNKTTALASGIEMVTPIIVKGTDIEELEAFNLDLNGHREHQDIAFVNIPESLTDQMKNWPPGIWTGADNAPYLIIRRHGTAIAFKFQIVIKKKSYEFGIGVLLMPLHLLLGCVSPIQMT